MSRTGNTNHTRRSRISPECGRASPRPAFWRSAATAILLVVLTGCGGESTPAPGIAGKGIGTGNPATKPQTPSNTKDQGGPSQIAADLDAAPAEAGARVEHHLRFVDVAASSGINFIYQNGDQGKNLMVESTGGGCGWLDYDGDGRWDLYLVQGGDPAQPPSPAQPADRLFRSLGEKQFIDVTDSCRIDERGYGQGTAVGDFDGDGFDDLFVTNVGRNRLFQNQGDGTFVETEAHVFGKESLWSASVAWGDIDRDGDLDLYVCRYALYDPLNPKRCYFKNGNPGICHPKEVDPCPDEFYLNEGDGTFRPVARERGLFGPGNRALGVAIVDLNNDGWPDIFVANDTTENFLFINQHDGKFVEQALLLGCAVNINGSPQANMGIAVGDYDRNGFLDLYVTHYHKEWNTLYQNLGQNGFHDVTAAAKLVLPTMEKLGWGTVMQDFDQNGFDDLFVANGHLTDLRSEGLDYQMPTQLFAFNGSTWDDCGESAGPFFQQKLLGRGVATCDYDDDGDLDLVMVSQNAPSALLRNESQRGHWLKVRFIGSSSNRRGIGTRVTLQSGTTKLMQELAGGTSYCASHQPVLVFGLGTSDAACDLEIRWPSGAVQRITGVGPDRSIVVRESESQGPAKP